jgi:acyl-coenzyme A thioesterase 13
MMTLESVIYEPNPANPHNSRTLFSLVVPRIFCNMAGSLHGGAVALIFDICTSTAIMPCSSNGFWDTGNVSRTLNCTYLRPVTEGQRIWVDSWVVHLGKKMGVIKGEIRNEAGKLANASHNCERIELMHYLGKVCYLCEHNKAVVGSSSL